MSAESSPPALRAECANCASWRVLPNPAAFGHGTFLAASGVCTKGLAPPEGDVLCARYEANESFKRTIVSRMMQDPMVLPVPLRGKKGKEARRRMRKADR